MALRDQPYLPLFVQDFMTDEKLMRCSASATGVYIRLMCYMHKSENYGVFAIKEKDRISDDISDDFARVFSLFSPFSQEEIRSAFQELLDEGVLYIYRNWLCQKRMMRDAELSAIRAEAGKKGAGKKHHSGEEFCHSKTSGKPSGKSLANTENEIEYENESTNDVDTTKSNKDIQEIRFDEFWAAYPKKVGKGAARKSWAKIKPTSELLKKMLVAVADAKDSIQWQKDDGQYIPNPSTWLNQNRWEDELDKQKPATRRERGQPAKSPSKERIEGTWLNHYKDPDKEDGI